MMLFSPFLTKRPSWFYVRKPATLAGIRFLRSDQQYIVQAVVVKSPEHP